MAVNLLNDKELNNYLINLVWGERGIPTILDGKSQENLKDTKYIEQNKDTIVRSILTQYMKHRIRAYLTESEEYPFLTPVSMRSDLPDWAIKALSNNQKIYEFNADNMTENMRHDLTTIRDFLYSAAESYVDKTVIAIKENAQKDKKKLPKVRLDYLKTSNEYDTFNKTLIAANKWHQNMAELATKKAKNEQMYKASLSGTKFIMDLPNRMKAYQLITPEALDYESEYMGHCVGQGAYDKGVSDGSIQIYSIRDSDGEPHATLEVRGKDVYQCKGKGNKTPVQRYIPAVQHFVDSQKFEIKHDMKNIGLIKQDGKYYSVYDLPDGFVVNDDLDLSGMDLTGVNLNIIVTGILDLRRCINLPPVLDFSRTKEVNLSYTDLSDVQEIKWPSEKIYLSECKNLPQVLDFSHAKEVDLRNADLSGVREIKCPNEFINLKDCKNLRQVLDFSKTYGASLENLDFSTLRIIKLPMSYIDLNGCKNLPSTLDFSMLEKVNLSHLDLSDVHGIKHPSKWIVLLSTKNLPHFLDFSKTEEVDLRNADLYGVREIKNPSEEIDLRNTKHLPVFLDFSKTEKVDLSDTDLSGVREIIGPSEKIYLNSCKNLPQALDFSHTKEVDLSGADLSDVQIIKWPITNVYLDKKDLPKHLYKSYDLWQAKLRLKATLNQQGKGKTQQKLPYSPDRANEY